MDKRQSSTPLLTAMRNYAAAGAVAFHTPGHKQGKGMHKAFKDLITATGFKMEVSLMAELDDLHDPQTCIKAAQELAAQLYGADVTHFAVNGTTGAIHTMLLAVLNPGDQVIVPRNAHRSIIGGIILAGACPIFMQPEIDEKLAIAMAVPKTVVEKALADYPQSKAVVLINPTYYGVAGDLQSIAELVHARGMLLLVDEAHGAHLKFNAKLPLAALDAGADIVAQSTHKLIGSLTQTSMLHARLERVDPERLRVMNSLIQSTSPNYLLLASLDVARMQMATEGVQLVDKAVSLANQARAAINQIAGLYCFGTERLVTAGAYALDVTKLTVTVKQLGISGAVAEQILWQEYQIQAELSDCYNVLFIISFSDSEREVDLLIQALRGLAARFSGQKNAEFTVACAYPQIPIMKLLPRQALFMAKQTVNFAAAAGMVAGEMITFYPPGIPVICPGELITATVINYCQTMQRMGLKVSGPEDETLKKIKVVK